jgi:Leucine-rich repeat (LRR) protein
LVVLFYSTGGVGKTQKGKSAWTNQGYWLSRYGYCIWDGVTCAEKHPTTDFDKNEILGLNLTRNGLNGDSLPSELFALSSLTSLDLSVNAISGTIPVELGNSRVIETVRLRKNRLSGSIPSEFGVAMNGLRALDLSDNSLHGSVPGTISFASNLKSLVLSKNELTGSLPNLRRIVELGKNKHAFFSA